VELIRRARGLPDEEKADAVNMILDAMQGAEDEQ